MNYSLGNIAEICGGVLLGADTVADTVMTDSRHGNGNGEHPLFVAMRGLNHDGHRFIGDLYRRGIRAFLIDSPVDTALYPDAGFVRVGKSLTALQKIAADYRSQFNETVVGITGSHGKTSVKEWIAQLMPAGMRVFRSPRSYNSQLGVPLSLLMMHGDERFALIEAGISRPGEMQSLAPVIRPEIGIFTSLDEEHSEHFGSKEEKLREKLSLFFSCRTIIYNGLDRMVSRVIKSMYPQAELIDASAYLSSAAVHFSDPHSRDNAALVLAFFDAAGIDSSEALESLTGLVPVDMQLGLREGLAGSVIVSDPVNTDINSLSIALDYLDSVAGEREKVVVMLDGSFGEMPGRELYESIGAAMRSSGVGALIGIGETVTAGREFFGIPGSFYDNVSVFLKNFTQDIIAGEAVLVKGGRGAELRKVIRQLERRSHTTVLEIDADALVHNLNHFRATVGQGVRLMAMVKASGYGNGNYELANLLQTQGVDYLAVAFADEGARLREQGINMPVVVLNADSDSFDAMIPARLEPEIYNFTSLEAFIRAVRESGESAYPVHIKLDTGMHRLGFMEADMERLADILARERGTVAVRSVFSHLAAADDPAQDGFTLKQISEFDRLSARLSHDLGICPMRHLANTAAIERFPQSRFDMCRLGIGLYGVSTEPDSPLKPVSRLITRIVQIKELDPCETVGYGRAGKLKEPARVATIPVGYADGLDRRLGEGSWSVLAGTARAAIIGKVCMDSCMIDVTGLEAAEGDEVTVFGPQQGNTVGDMARVLGTIPYEIMTSISERVKRIYIKE